MSDVRIDFVERAQSAVARYPPPASSSFFSMARVPSSRASYNAVDTHDHSKELDDDEMAEQEEEEEVEVEMEKDP